jgi:porin
MRLSLVGVPRVRMEAVLLMRSVIVMAVCLLAAVAQAQPQPASPTAAAADSATPPTVIQREQLTGDWGGGRTTAAARGVTFQIELTGFAQDLLAGDGNDQAEPGARFDALVNFDTARLGLWHGGGFRTHLESRTGEIPIFRGGALWPMSSGTLLPLGGPDRFVLSSLYYTHRLGKATSLLVGKINAVDLLAADPFFGGWGIHRFQNIAFVAPPSGVVPPTIVGAIVSHRAGAYSITGMVFDPNDQTNDYWVDGLFDDGVNVSIAPGWSGKVHERDTTVSLTAAFSTADGASLGELLLPPDLKTGDKDGSFNIALQASHLIRPSAVLQGLELFYNLAIAKWFRLAADLQVVGPAHASNSTAVVASVRADVVF